MMKTVTFVSHDVQLILENDELEELAASAAISLNPNVLWAKVVLTDDDYNANRQRIPRSEFANVIRTGLFMPLKMAYGEIQEGHDNSFPLGAFAHLKTEGNTIQTLVAIWAREREEDASLIKERFKSGKPLDVSWEVTYTDFTDTDKGRDLKNVSMNAATLVGMPAYQGRTPIIAVSKKEGEDMDTISIDKHEQLLKDQKDGIVADYEKKLTDKQTELEAAQAELNEVKPKVVELESFKTEVEAERAKAAKLEQIKKKFSDAGLTVEGDYFEKKTETLLAMSEEALDFFVQELVAALDRKEDKEDAAKEDKASISITSTKVPNVTRSSNDDVSAGDILKYLKGEKS
jgi:hypothetical protein